jgi:type II secretory pathway pseudopilin PulG
MKIILNRTLKSPIDKVLTVSPKGHNQRGFALVATMMIMSLLAIVSFGMMSLSSVTVRSASQGSAMEEARANARMALMQAIGELQELAGQDTRVTSSSHLIDESAVRVTGVWRSWEGSDRQSDGKPIAPNYDAKRMVGDSQVAVTDAAEDGRFLGWLASVELPVDPDDAFPVDMISNQANDGMMEWWRWCLLVVWLRLTRWCIFYQVLSMKMEFSLVVLLGG